MHKIKYLQILNTLKPNEFKLFGKFIDSKHVNSNNKLKQLYSLLKKCYPNFSHPFLQKQNLSKKLFPTKRFREKRIRVLDSEMLKLTQRFIGCLSCTDNRIKYKEMLLDGLSKKGCETVIIHNLNEIEADLKFNTMRDSNYYYWKYLHQKSINSMYVSRLGNKKQVDYIAESHYFEMHTFLVQTDIYLKMLAFEYGDIVHYSELGIQEALRKISLKPRQYEEIPIVGLFYISYLLVSEFRTDYFLSLRELYFQHKNELSLDQKHCILKILIVFLIHQVNCFGSSKGELLVHLENLFCEYCKYFNIFNLQYDIYYFLYFFVSLSLDLNKVERIEQFVNKIDYNNKEKIHNTIKNLALAKIYVYKKVYAKAFEILNKIKRTIWFYELEIRYLSIICLIETAEIDDAEYQLRNLERYLKNDKILEHSRKQGRGFVRNMKIYLHLSKIHNKKNSKFARCKYQIDYNSPYTDWIRIKMESVVL